MNKNKVALIAAVTLSLAGLTFSSVSAADTATTVDTGSKSAPSGKFHHKRGGHFGSPLGLTDAQLEKLNALKIEYSNASGPKRAELMSLRRELRDGMTKPGVSKSELLSLQSKINGLNNELSNNKVAFMADRMSVFTDEQKAKLRSFALKKQMMGGSKHFRGGKHFGAKKFHHRGGRSFGVKPAAPAADKQV